LYTKLRMRVWSGCYQGLWWEFDQAVIRDCDQALMRLWSGCDQAVIMQWLDTIVRDCDQQLWSGS
jgi:hypothetical protein